MNHHEHNNHIVHSFSFVELWRPELLLAIIGIALIYILIVGKWREKFTESAPVPTWQKSVFLMGLLVMYLGLGTPLNAYGHHILFSAHMTQMALLYLVMPPLLLLGTPSWLVRFILKPTWLMSTVSFLTLPLVSIILFNVLFSLYHFPLVFDAVMASHGLHFVYHTILIIGAFLMWWPVSCPLPELNRLSDLKKIAYIFISGVMLTPVCALIIFAAMPMYTTYVDAPQIFNLLPSLDDQQLGGVIMKVIQEVSYITAIAFVFYAWARKERQKENENAA